MVDFGIEEEVYITEPDRPSLRSLYFMSRLLWSNPAFWYVHSDSNFTRGKDIRLGVMGPVEVSTRRASGASKAIEELRKVRQSLCRYVDGGLLVPLGQLANVDAPTLTSGMHVHVGGVADLDRVYDNIAYFLPLLMLITANSPSRVDGLKVKSYRILRSYAIGPIRDDRFYRFQDIIISRRLGTVEVRIFDPIWDTARIELLLECLEALATTPRHFVVDRYTYQQLRYKAAVSGYGADLVHLYEELTQVISIPEAIFTRIPADDTAQLFEERGVVGAYASIDFAYRTSQSPWEYCPGQAPLPPVGQDSRRLLEQALGLICYYAVRAPYKLGKAWLEWHKSPRVS
ncbi:MAG TPA: hypothetical protein GXX40_03850 [Firmicutes bacterium]|nr:hypothetical protein [Bacillota bacterium]